MGGSGGGSRRTSHDIAKRIEAAREQEIARLSTDVNEYLAELLAKFNARDPALANSRLDAIADVLRDVAEIEAVLLGGSVAKHTAVDGISDVDALVVLNRKDLEGKTPGEVKDAFFAQLCDQLPRSEVADVSKGEMAVTVTYKDGNEIQLLPALRSGTRVLLATPASGTWSEINLKRFQSALTRANEKVGRTLVPAIKLLKAINADLPPQKRLTGYHIEALAVDAARTYSGSNVPREVLIHLCKHAAERVLKPIADPTGQSHCVDDYLGAADGPRRRIAGQALSGIARRLETAGSIGEWKAVFGTDE